MKKFALMLLLASVAFAGCKKDDDDDVDPVDPFEPKQEQWGFAVNYTRVNCPPCGSWGATLIHSLSDAGKTVAITNHAGPVTTDAMHNQQLYQSMAVDRPSGGGIPAFWVADEKVGQSDAMSKLNSVLSKAATTGIILKHSKSGGNMVVETRTKFFSAGSGDYYLSVWVLESGIPGGANAPQGYKQSGTSDPNYTHDFVLRASSVPGQSYGELLVSNPEAGKVFDKTYTIPLDAEWNKQLYAAALLWKYDATSSPNYQFVNAYQVK